jgi:crotonobetainyl-CoA:carnitine CoA-transferase CaiB-like acyl-CoA transferase
VAEASHILAASMAGALLGAMGADVVKLEDAGRLDQYRRSGPFIDGHNDPEWSGYFAIANHSKRSFVFTSRAELDDALAASDVVIENWGTSRARRYGVDSASIGRRWPQKLAVSSSGFGHIGPLSGYRVYAYNLNAYCGVLDTLAGPTGKLPGLDFAWADFISAYSLATVVGAWAIGGAVRGEAPHGAQVDSAMAEVVVQRLNEVLLDAELADAGVPAGGDDPVDYLFATDGGTGYVAVTIRGEEDRKHLATIAGTDESAAEDDLRTALRGRSGTTVASALRTNGVAVCRVADASEMLADPHLRDRGFFASVSHPGWGPRSLIGVPWRFADEPAPELTPPPQLGDAGAAGPWRRRAT